MALYPIEYPGEIELLAGSGGVFEITQEDRLLFSKKATGHFPTDEELQALNLRSDE